MKNIEPAIIYQRRNIVGLAITYSCRITCTAIIQPCIPNFISQMRKLTFSSLVRSKTGFFQMMSSLLWFLSFVLHGTAGTGMALSLVSKLEAV